MNFEDLHRCVRSDALAEAASVCRQQAEAWQKKYAQSGDINHLEIATAISNCQLALHRLANK
jgi:hypothetical protein